MYKRQVYITPESATVEVGGTVTLTANVSANWASSDTSKATVSSGQTTSVTVTAVAAGTVTITASRSGYVSDTATVTVRALSTNIIEVTPSFIVVREKGGNQRLSALIKNRASGAVVSGQAVTWSSANTNIATVTSSGRVYGVSQGETTICAESGDAVMDITVAVVPRYAIVESAGTPRVQKIVVTQEPNALLLSLIHI